MDISVYPRSKWFQQSKVYSSIIDQTFQYTQASLTEISVYPINSSIRIFCRDLWQNFSISFVRTRHPVKKDRFPKNELWLVHFVSQWEVMSHHWSSRSSSYGMCLKHWNIGSSRYCNLIHTEGILKPEFTESILKSDSRGGYTEILWIHRGYTEIWSRVYWNMNSSRVYWNMNPSRIYWNMTEGILKYGFIEGILKYESIEGILKYDWGYTEIWIHRWYTEIWPRVYWNMNSGYTEIWPRVYWNMNPRGYTEIWIHRVLRVPESQHGYTEIIKIFRILKKCQKQFSPAGILKSQNCLACHVRCTNHTHAMWTFSFPCPKREPVKKRKQQYFSVFDTL